MSRKVATQEEILAVMNQGFRVEDADSWKYKWSVLRNNAKKRGCNCNLTFSDYLELANAAGLVSPNQIGKSSSQYNMARFGDTGDYTIGNCRFLTKVENLHERTANGGTERGASKRRGLTAENSPIIARMSDNLRGRTKDNYEYLKSISNKRSKPYSFIDPDGVVHKGFNLLDFCKLHGLDQRNMHKVLTGKARQHKGWTILKEINNDPQV